MIYNFGHIFAFKHIFLFLKHLYPLIYAIKHKRNVTKSSNTWRHYLDKWLVCIIFLRYFSSENYPVSTLLYLKQIPCFIFCSVAEEFPRLKQLRLWCSSIFWFYLFFNTHRLWRITLLKYLFNLGEIIFKNF